LDGLAAVIGPATHTHAHARPVSAEAGSPDSCIGRPAGKPGLAAGADLISSARAPGVWALATASRFGGAVAGRTGVVFVCAAGPCENKGSKHKT